MKNKIFAFTLIELSFVIIIVGILIAGVMTASSLVKKSKIVAAQTLTKSSPINGIKDIALWIESSAEFSFKENESSNGDAISTWYDKKNYLNKSSILSVGTGPTYSNTINDIPAVKFSGSNANYLQIADASFLNNADYTIVVLEKRQSATAGYFIGDNTVSTANQTLLLGYSADAVISHSQGDNNIYSSNISTYSSSIDAPRIFTFVFDSTNGKKTYINGILAGENSNTNKLNNITTLAIGKGYTGEIGEIAIFTRALKLEERKSIEDYLGKKFSIKINRGSAANGSCMNGIVSTNGCDMSLETCSISQAGVSATVVSPAANPTTLSCNVNHYSGTVSYTCINGTPSVSGSCGCATGYTGVGCATCDTANGYASGSGGTCVLGCKILSGNGTSTTDVAPGSSSITCDSVGFAGNLTYTCSGGVLGVVKPCIKVCTSTGGGGTPDTTTVPGSVIHTFKSKGTLTCSSKTVEVLIVAGGGGGGNNIGGGGGGGGVLYNSSVSLSANSYDIIVGNGGVNSGNGAPSIAFGLTAIGGGAGGGCCTAAPAPSGGSGGGNRCFVDNSTNSFSTPGLGVGGQGFRGGTCSYNSPNAVNAATGGGGGGGVGLANASISGGGGPGVAYSISGTSKFYGGGGGGGGLGGGFGNGGTGGGGNGVNGNSSGPTSTNNGTENTGGGGGGGGCCKYSKSGNGGSGIVIVRYNN